MKYSLRSMMIVVTLACVVCGRIGYLIERSQFHRREAQRYAAMVSDPNSHKLPVLTLIVRHSRLADAYGYAAYHPWTVIHEGRVADGEER